MNPPLGNQNKGDLRRAAETRLPPARAANSRSEGPNTQPAAAGQIPGDILDQLLEPGLWRAGLEQFALATNMAVQLFDNRGQAIGECLNPQPLWRVLVSNRAASAGCAFCVSSSE